MPPRGILDYRSTVLTDPTPAGGTTGALKARDGNGAMWLVKHYSGNPDRVATELLANAIYRELDILVPAAGIGRWSGPTGEEWVTVTYPMVEGETRRWTEPNEALAEGFVADALLANWDVIGLIRDNILWQGHHPVRLDQGGCFEFRAMGERKEYGPEPVELGTMLGPLGQARDAMEVTSSLIRRKGAETARILSAERVEDLVASAAFEDLEMRERIRFSLISRVNWLDFNFH